MQMPFEFHLPGPVRASAARVHRCGNFGNSVGKTRKESLRKPQKEILSHLCLSA